MTLQREEVRYVRSTVEDRPIDGAVELAVICYAGNVGTRVELYVLPEARKKFPVDQLWEQHGWFLEDQAFNALQQLV